VTESKNTPASGDEQADNLFYNWTAMMMRKTKGKAVVMTPNLHPGIG